MSPEMVRRRELARVRAAAARERVRTIRRRVAVGAASVFAAAWVGVFGQLVSGQDPALGSGTTSSSKTAAVSGSTAGASHRRSRSSAETTGTVAAPQTAVTPTQPAVAATPLTTRQS